ncbi:arylacetamide deacetylase-like 3 isoform X1 [Astyanax mexicanus]|uniref:Arylacetamide deacetylase-like 3 isoform X1 n=1 Tax=Astyanax mexicanus TaxID=7994 RepID=A0A8T2KRE2_ASTMX|nr:arylacetamide deacetylase-like 3 isoform X1 [Astyanax mexicanus]
MEIGAAGTLAAGFSVFAGIFGLLYLGLVYFEARRAEIPPGVSNRKKLCALHYSIVGMEVGCQILECLGVCSQLTVFRLLANYMNHKTPVAPPGLRIKDMTFGGVPVIVYEPTAPSDQKRRGMMYFHGGGWVLGNITMYDEVCKHIAKESDTTIVSVGYRLAPEHRFPAHLDDCEAATLHFFSVAEAEFGVDPHRVVLGGDSAGGNLSAALSQRLAKKRTGDVPSPLALVLIYPALQMADFTLPSYLQNQSVPLLYRDKAAYYFLQYLNGDMSVCQEVLAGRHVPAELKAHYSKWLDPANLPPEFRERSYQKPEGLPPHQLMYHHSTPTAHYLVSLYDESYGRQHTSDLPTLRTWHSDKLGWIPERSDHPVQGPPTNYGLLESLQAQGQQQQGVLPMLSVYKAAYPLHPTSAFCQPRHARAPRLISSNKKNLELKDKPANTASLLPPLQCV